MVNNKFYEAINGLYQQATGGDTLVVADYDSFIDAGKKITDIAAVDLQNGFITALMNRIATVVNTARSYSGAYTELIKGSLEYGNTVELIVNSFYETQAAGFIGLQDGESVDQYVVNKPKVDAKFYVDTNAYTIPITIAYPELKKAFTSPAEMDAFISNATLYVLNSDELMRENGRIAMVAKIITDDLKKNAAATIDTPAQVYNLVSLFNEITGASLTSANCLYSEDFVKFAVKTINMVCRKTERVSQSFNADGIKTFTPAGERRLFCSSSLVSSIGTYVHPSAFNMTPDIQLESYITVPFWQNEDHPYTVTYKDSTETKTTVPVVAVMLDSYAAGEWIKKRDMRTTPFNARGEYWNNFLNVEVQYLTLSAANSVIFTLA